MCMMWRRAVYIHACLRRRGDAMRVSRQRRRREASELYARKRKSVSKAASFKTQNAQSRYTKKDKGRK